MNSSKKRGCIICRTNSIPPADEPKMNRQRTFCLTFARQKSRLPIRKFQEKIDDKIGPAKNDDTILKLRAGAKQGKLDILLVSESARIGQVPLECSFDADFSSAAVLEYGIQQLGILDYVFCIKLCGTYK